MGQFLVVFFQIGQIKYIGTWQKIDPDYARYLRFVDFQSYRGKTSPCPIKCFLPYNNMNTTMINGDFHHFHKMIFARKYQ